MPVATKLSNPPFLVGDVPFTVGDMPLGFLEKLDLRLAIHHALTTNQTPPGFKLGHGPGTQATARR